MHQHLAPSSETRGSAAVMHMIPVPFVHGPDIETQLSTASASRLAKERSAEDHLFGDKDRFITSAYKNKLQACLSWSHWELLSTSLQAC